MENQKMIIWSPSSWALWKQCPAKYRIKQLERWKYPKVKQDNTFAKLAVPGLVVDKLLQLWIHRNQFCDSEWMGQNFEMIWSMVNAEVLPVWSTEEAQFIKTETLQGISNSVKLIEKLNLSSNRIITQASFFETITEDYGITGAADLLVIDEKSNRGVLVDFKNSHSRHRLTKDQLVIYQLGLEQKLSLSIHQAGYLMFNPRLNDWKWFNLKNPAHKEKMIEKLAVASQLIRNNQFDYDWNKFTCFRFCEVRFSCEVFQKYTGVKITPYS